ncbi:MAG: porin family protein [Vicinamibacteria bacterium]|nr:porin family protein [Vicinamibacteria bacterium]
MRSISLSITITTILLTLSATVGARDTAAQGQNTPGFAKKWIGSRLTVGARLNHYGLIETRRYGDNGLDNANLTTNFVGSLWGLDTKQHGFPNPFVEYRLAKGIGIGVAYDELRAKTLDWTSDEKVAIGGDGDLEIRGVNAYITARYKNRTRFEPFVFAGYAWYNSDFDESPEWAAPGRYFVVAGTDGWVAGGGGRVRVTSHIGADVTYRHAQLRDVSARAVLTGGGGRNRTGAFPMRYNAFALGLSYTF